MCNSVLHYYSVLQCMTVYYSVLQCVTVYYSELAVLEYTTMYYSSLHYEYYRIVFYTLKIRDSDFYYCDYHLVVYVKYSDWVLY